MDIYVLYQRCGCDVDDQELRPMDPHWVGVEWWISLMAISCQVVKETDQSSVHVNEKVAAAVGVSV